MKKSVIAALCLFPFVWGCQGQNGSAKFETDYGTIDARKHAKECVELEKTNPKKIEINASYQNKKDEHNQEKENKKKAKVFEHKKIGCAQKPAKS